MDIYILVHEKIWTQLDNKRQNYEMQSIFQK